MQPASSTLARENEGVGTVKLGIAPRGVNPKKAAGELHGIFAIRMQSQISGILKYQIVFVAIRPTLLESLFISVAVGITCRRRQLHFSRNGLPGFAGYLQSFDSMHGLNNWWRHIRRRISELKSLAQLDDTAARFAKVVYSAGSVRHGGGWYQYSSTSRCFYLGTYRRNQIASVATTVEFASYQRYRRHRLRFCRKGRYRRCNACQHLFKGFISHASRTEPVGVADGGKTRNWNRWHRSLKMLLELHRLSATLADWDMRRDY